jgi:hypothetical protein
VSGSSSQALEWAVNGTVGGTPQAGTIAVNGVYTAPPSANETVAISAALQTNPTIQGYTETSIIGPASSPGQIGFAFTLPTAAATSAGVYNSQGTLLRTLWSNQSYAAGAHVETWDGQDDYGTPVDSDTYLVKVLYSNVTYEWGLIGDTSTSWGGPDNWDALSDLPEGMAFSETNAYMSNGYSEGRPNSSYFNTATPQEPLPLLNIGYCNVFRYVTSDGERVYFGNVGDALSGGNSFVIAVDGTTGSQYKFPSGATASNCGPPVSGIIDIDPNIPTGIAVQANGNILAVSHGTYYGDNLPTLLPGEDAIRLFDKISGAFLGMVSIRDPQQLAFSSDGTLWAISNGTVVQIASVGQQNNIVRSLPDVSAPVAITVDLKTGVVLVGDGGTVQQIKRFSSAGELLSTYGDLGGYTDCNPTVTNTRLYLDSTAGGGAGNNQTPHTWLAVQPDGSFWIGDLGNDRMLHVSEDGQYLNQVAFMRYLYRVATDHGDPSRIFADFLEFKVDYSKPLLPGDPDPNLGGNGSWSLAKNWSVCVPAQYDPWFVAVDTYGNGRTYAELYNNDVRSQLSGAAMPEVAELPTSGPLRFSGSIVQDSGNSEIFDNDGNLAYWKVTQTGNNIVDTAYKSIFVGYDENGFPEWGDTQASASVSSNFGDTTFRNSTEPLAVPGGGMEETPQATSGGFYVSFNTTISTAGSDHHIGGVKAGASSWSWKASPGGMLSSPDGEGTFSDSNLSGLDGITALVEGSNVFEGYNGNWGTFSSQWMHWSEDGLLIGQFGNTPQSGGNSGTLVPGAAGNILTMATVPVNGNIYLYTSDEGYHPGIHSWKISGLDSVHEESGSAPIGGVLILQ